MCVSRQKNKQIQDLAKLYKFATINFVYKIKYFLEYFKKHLQLGIKFDTFKNVVHTKQKV